MGRWLNLIRDEFYVVSRDVTIYHIFFNYNKCLYLYKIKQTHL